MNGNLAETNGNLLTLASFNYVWVIPQDRSVKCCLQLVSQPNLQLDIVWVMPYYLGS